MKRMFCLQYSLIFIITLFTASAVFIDSFIEPVTFHGAQLRGALRELKRRGVPSTCLNFLHT